ncbi:MAG: Rpn family recombination-promoting nuclease/putative transposase [Anaerolineae bacterium]|nr:Rpn family recombination-promoting nuclease/putative transposase [Anaerolineae bacterium]
MKPLYFNPRVDFAFKRVFGSPQNEDVLISFLDAVLYAGAGRIRTAQILNPYVPGETQSHKETHVDVRVMLDNRREVLIEMQMINVLSFAQRVLYNVAKVYGSQLNRGNAYEDLHGVIGLTIANFTLFPAQDAWHSHFTLRETTTGMAYPGQDNIELVFVELPKFDSKHADLSRKENQWALFLKEGEMLEENVQAYLMRDPVIQRAYENLEMARMKGSELQELESRETWLRDRIGEVQFALTTGRAEGRVEGRVEGRAEGIELGMEQMVLRQLKRKFGAISPILQAQVVALDVSQLEQLADELLDFQVLDDLQHWLATQGVK